MAPLFHPSADRGWYQRLQKPVLTIILTGFCVLRFVQLAADFPAEVTWSAAPFTDEGGYSSAAVRYHLQGDWFLPGDENPAVVVPFFPMLQIVNLYLFGISLPAARIPVCILFTLAVVALYGLIRNEHGDTSALLIGIVVATNYLLFVYSRVAFLEIPMMSLGLVCACLLDLAVRRSSRVLAGLTGIIGALAVLAKTTALFALPGLALLSIDLRPRESRRASQTLPFVVGLTALLALYCAGLALPYREDWLYHWSHAPALEPMGSPLELAGRLHDTLRDVFYRAPVLSVGMVVAAVGGVRWWKSLIQNRVILFVATWYITYFAFLFATKYRPTRYILPIVLVTSVLVPLVALELTRQKQTKLAILLFLLISCSVFINVTRVALYLFNPENTYTDMAADVKRRVPEEGAVLMGQLAPQVSLASGIPGVSGELGTASRRWRMECYRPTHYLQIRPLPRGARRDLEDLYEVELLETYELAPRREEPVLADFFRLVPKERRFPETTLPGCPREKAKTSSG